jgi:hypothetical protein
MKKQIQAFQHLKAKADKLMEFEKEIELIKQDLKEIKGLVDGKLEILTNKGKK